jgi:hypothetical protein
VIAVNGIDVSKAAHKEAVDALLKPVKEITLTVRHEPLPKGWKVCNLIIFIFFLKYFSFHLKFSRCLLCFLLFALFLYSLLNEFSILLLYLLLKVLANRY